MSKLYEFAKLSEAEWERQSTGREIAGAGLALGGLGGGYALHHYRDPIRRAVRNKFNFEGGMREMLSDEASRKAVLDAMNGEDPGVFRRGLSNTLAGYHRAKATGIDTFRKGWDKIPVGARKYAPLAAGASLGLGALGGAYAIGGPRRGE